MIPFLLLHTSLLIEPISLLTYDDTILSFLNWFYSTISATTHVNLGASVRTSTNEIGGKIGQAVVDHAMYISTLSVAILGGMVAMQYQFKLSNISIIHWIWLFWIAIGFAALTVTMGLIIFGLYIELTPVLHGFSFDLSRDFSSQNFHDTKIEWFRNFSRIQISAFACQLIFGSAFVFRNIRVDSSKD